MGRNQAIWIGKAEGAEFEHCWQQSKAYSYQIVPRSNSWARPPPHCDFGIGWTLYFWKRRRLGTSHQPNECGGLQVGLLNWATKLGLKANFALPNRAAGPRDAGVRLVCSGERRKRLHARETSDCHSCTRRNPAGILTSLAPTPTKNWAVTLGSCEFQNRNLFSLTAVV